MHSIRIAIIVSITIYKYPIVVISIVVSVDFVEAPFFYKVWNLGLRVSIGLRAYKT